MACLCFKGKRTHVLNRAIESVVGSWSLAGGLVHRGGDNGSAWTTAGLSGAGGPVPGLVGVGGIGDGGRTDSGVVGAVGTALGGGVVGDSNSSEDRAGLPIPDSLRKIWKRLTFQNTIHFSKIWFYKYVYVNENFSSIFISQKEVSKKSEWDRKPRVKLPRFIWNRILFK